MKKGLLLLIVILLVAGAYWFWPRPAALVQPQAPQVPQAPAAVADNHDARGLSAAEQAAFLPLVCGGASAGSDGFAHDCASLPGYPSADYGGAGTGLGITLTSIITGHLTSATADEAYVSYQGSFESHADNFGGGILFSGDGKGGWHLVKWVEGAAMDGCLSLNPQGRAVFLCQGGSTGQGETDTVLLTRRIPSATGQLVLKASDLRQTLDPNENCRLRQAGQDVLLGIGGIARSGNGYTAGISYIPAAVAAAACKAKHFASAPVSKASLSLNWDGQAMHIAPGFKFAPSS